MGRGRFVDSRSGIEELANEAAINNIQPREVVNATETIMAIGAARAAPATSSDIWAAASSFSDGTSGRIHHMRESLTACKGPHGCGE
jgi:hypothetical protein